VKSLHRLLAGVVLSAGVVTCGVDQDERERVPLYVTCLVSWSGSALTDSRAFNIRACHFGRCTRDISVQAALDDGGLAVEERDAGCVPTTPGGPPAHCEFRPFVPGPGCGVGEIGDDFSVLACARGGSEGTDFSITLTPSTDSFPDDDDQFGLTIRTTAGSTLVEARGNVGSSGLPIESDSPCRGAAFDLDGNRIVGF
jgi:hypothetical protein